MLSTCPSCLSQVNHADHLFDVTCECGVHFSPYLNVDTPAENTPGEESKSNSFAEYAESNTAFEDIVKFGEQIGGGDMDTPIEPLTMSNIASMDPPPAETNFDTGKPPATPPSFAAREMLLTTGSEVSGYVIQTHFAPVSLVTPFLTAQPNPLQNGISQLWKMAEGMGANAVIGLQTTITPDSQNVLLVGIPVRCSKVV